MCGHYAGLWGSGCSLIDKKSNPRTIKAYSHVSINTDFSIHLIHDSEKPEYGGSRLGVNLVAALKAFGLVNHSVWVEIQTN
jgi:hypothetical protein